MKVLDQCPAMVCPRCRRLFCSPHFPLLSLLFQSPLPQTKLNKGRSSNKHTDGFTSPSPHPQIPVRLFLKQNLAWSPWRPPHSHASQDGHWAMLAPGPPTCYSLTPTVFLELSFSYSVLPAAHLKPVSMRILSFFLSNTFL